uniref:Uncharacterized protein n=1 Tax=Anguilla anguilla TaxID=7936 RepID=A0A0E9US35_ANGAN
MYSGSSLCCNYVPKKIRMLYKRTYREEFSSLRIHIN